MSNSDLTDTQKEQGENEVQTDIKLVVECIKCQLDNPTALKQALLTLATLLSRHENEKDFFRKAGGIKFLVELLTTSKHEGVKGVLLYVMACIVERNVFSQKEMSSAPIFAYLNDVMTCPYSKKKVIKSAIYFIMCLVANNSQGQMMLRQSGCLQKLLSFFRDGMQSSDDCTSPISNRSHWWEKTDQLNTDLWTSITSALCVCVNNPQNEENQRLCTAIFPYAFKRLKSTNDPKIIKSVVSLISLAVGNNVHNQERVACSDGIHSLVGCLSRVADKAKRDEEFLVLAGQIAAAIGTCVTDNVPNAKLVGELGGINLLIELLRINPIDFNTKEQIVVTLGYCVECCEKNKMFLIKENGFTTLIQHLVSNEEDDFNRAVKFVLRTCTTGQKNIHGISDQEAGVTSTLKQLYAKCEALVEITKKHQQDMPHSVERNLEQQVRKLIQNQKLLEQRIEHVSCLKMTDMAAKNQTSPTSVNGENGLMEGEEERFQRELGKERDGCEKKKFEDTSVKEVDDDIKKKEQTCPIERTIVAQVRKMEEMQVDANNLVGRNLDENQNKDTATKENEPQITNSEIHMDITDCPFTKTFIQPSGEQERCLDSPGNCSVPKLMEKISERVPRMKEIREAPSRTINKKNASSSTYDLKTYSPCYWPNAPLNNREFAKPTASVKKRTFSSSSSTLRYSMKRTLLPTNAIAASPASTTGQRHALCATAVQCPQKTSRLPEVNSLHLGLEVMRDRETNCPEKMNVTVQEDICVTPCKKRLLQGKTVNYSQNETTASGNYRCVTPIKRKMLPVNNNQSQGMIGRDNNLVTPVKRKQLHEKSSYFRASTGASKSLNADSLIKSPHYPGEHLEDDTQSEFDMQVVQHAMKQVRSNGCLNGSSVNISNIIMDAQANDNNTVVRNPKQWQNDEVILRNTSKFTGTPTSRHLKKNEFVDQDKDLNDPLSEHRGGFVDSGACKDTTDSGNSQCPGCQAPVTIGCPVLNSRTFNIALETSQFACSKHRLLRNAERQHLITLKRKKKQTQRKMSRQPLSDQQQQNKNTTHKNYFKSTEFCLDKQNKNTINVYDFKSSESDDDLTKKVTPPNSPISSKQQKWSASTRRKRIPYTEQEIKHLKEGVEKIGTRWQQILCAYPFHPSRTSVDLKEKYCRFLNEKQRNQVLLSHKPFSMCEMRRLKRGVRLHGYNWNTILRSFKFDKERTPADLRSKWKIICNATVV